MSPGYMRKDRKKTHSKIMYRSTILFFLLLIILCLESTHVAATRVFVGANGTGVWRANDWANSTAVGPWEGSALTTTGNTAINSEFPFGTFDLQTLMVCINGICASVPEAYQNATCGFDTADNMVFVADTPVVTFACAPEDDVPAVNVVVNDEWSILEKDGVHYAYHAIYIDPGVCVASDTGVECRAFLARPYETIEFVPAISFSVDWRMISSVSVNVGLSRTSEVYMEVLVQRPKRQPRPTAESVAGGVSWGLLLLLVGVTSSIFMNG